MSTEPTIPAATVQDPATVAAEMLANVPQPAPEPQTAPEPSPAAEPSPDAPRDAHGHAFRPGFHRENPDGTPYTNARGDYMPRGGRRKGVPNAPTPPPAQPWSEAERRAAVSPPPAESSPESQPAAPGTPPPAESAAPGATMPGAVDLSESGAEVGCRVVYTLSGAIFNAFEDCEPAAREHDQLRKSLAAYIRSKGWTATAGWAIFLEFCGYLLRLVRKPGPSKQLRAWFADWRASQATPVAPVQVEPPPAGVTEPRVTISPVIDNLTERPA